MTGQWEQVDAIRDMYAHGRGRVVMRAQCAFEETRQNRMAIVVTELPYQVNKAALVEKIAELVKGKKIDGIADLRDESDRDGMRMVIECKRDVNPHKVLNNLFKHTPLQLAFNTNMVALVDGQPQTLPLKAILQHHIDWRREVVRRRTEFDLRKARDRAHILEGLKIALDNLDAVISTIRESADVDTARTNLIARFELTEIQANAILEMQLRRLAALERKKIEDEYLAIIQLIAELEDILANPARVLAIIKDELSELARKYAGERRTRIADDASRELSDEDLIADEDVVVTVCGRGYIKRQPLVTYRRQARGGKGIIGARTVEEDAVAHLLVANTHDWALFFTDRGRVFSSKVHQVPDASPTGQGHAHHQPRGRPGGDRRAGPRRASRCPTSRRATTWSWPPGGASSRRRPSSSSSGSARRASGPSPSPRTTRWPGSACRPAATTSSSPRPRAASPASTSPRCGRWAATRPASSASAWPARATRSWAWASSSRPTTSWCSPRPATASASRSPSSGPSTAAARASGSSRWRARKTGPVAAVQLVTEDDEELLLISAGGQVVRTDVKTINRYGSAARGVIVMRLNEGDTVAGIAVFRAGLAEQRAMGDNDGPAEDGPPAGA